jgi:hypothetical protein
MRRTLIGMTMGLMGAALAIAQPIPSPFANIGGAPVAAHHVRLEGTVGTQSLYRLLRTNQELCARLGRIVDLPPEGTPVFRITRDDYYTATHLIQFTRKENLQINSDCVASWQEQTPSLLVTSPQGACTFNMRARMALGMCESTPGAPLTILPTLGQEVLGTDTSRNCVRTAARMGGLLSVQCVELPPEPWRSFLYRAGADRRGIVLEDIVTLAPNEEEVATLRAVEVRKNITVGSDMLNLARSLGYRINPGVEPRR